MFGSASSANFPFNFNIFIYFVQWDGSVLVIHFRACVYYYNRYIVSSMLDVDKCIHFIINEATEKKTSTKKTIFLCCLQKIFFIFYSLVRCQCFVKIVKARYDIDAGREKTCYRKPKETHPASTLLWLNKRIAKEKKKKKTCKYTWKKQRFARFQRALNA